MKNLRKMAAPEIAGLGVSVEIDAGLSSERVWRVLEHKVQCPQDYLPVTDVVVRPNPDGSTYRELTAMGKRIIENIYTSGAPAYEVLFKVRPLFSVPSAVLFRPSPSASRCRPFPTSSTGGRRSLTPPLST